MPPDSQLPADVSAASTAPDDARSTRRPFLPLLLLSLYVFLPGLGLLAVGVGGETASGMVDRGLIRAYFIHAALLFSVAWFLSAAKHLPGNGAALAPLDCIATVRRVVVAIAAVAAVLFVLGGADVLFHGVARGELRVSFGALGFLYTWLQIYVTPFLVATAARCHQSTTNVRSWAIATYAIALFIGSMSGYKFTTVLIFLPAATLWIRRVKWQRLAALAAAAMMINVAMDMRDSGRDATAATEYVFARATVVAAYGVVGSWHEFSESGASMQRLADSAVLWLGAKVASAVTGIAEDSIEFLRFNLSRYITYHYYPDAEGAVNGTVNLTLTVFSEAIAFFGGAYYWIWSIASGVVLGFVLRWYARTVNSGDVSAAVCILVYFFAVLLGWVNSSGWITIVSLPVMIGLVALRMAVSPLIFVWRAAEGGSPLPLADPEENAT